MNITITDNEGEVSITNENAELCSEVVLNMVVPALVALGYHENSIKDAFDIYDPSEYSALQLSNVQLRAELKIVTQSLKSAENALENISK